MLNASTHRVPSVTESKDTHKRPRPTNLPILSEFCTIVLPTQIVLALAHAASSIDSPFVDYFCQMEQANLKPFNNSANDDDNVQTGRYSYMPETWRLIVQPQPGNHVCIQVQSLAAIVKSLLGL